MRIPPRWAGDITENPLRSGRPVSLSTPSGARFVSIDGGWREKPDTGVLSTPHDAGAELSFRPSADIRCTVLRIASRTALFRCRAGTGRACAVRHSWMAAEPLRSKISHPSICAWLARACVPATAVLRPLLCAPGVGLLIAGAPGSGKTTLLRAVLAELSAAGRKTAVVDERFEIAPVEQSGFCTRLPQHCDVLSGYPKHIGMQHALRALAPDVIVCDEVGAMEDIAAITQAANAGVGLVVTIHAPDAETLRRRPQYTALLQTGAFPSCGVFKR